MKICGAVKYVTWGSDRIWWLGTAWGRMFHLRYKEWAGIKGDFNSNPTEALRGVDHTSNDDDDDRNDDGDGLL